MSKLIAFFFLILPMACNALTCAKYDPPAGAKIELKKKSEATEHWFNYSLPASLDGEELNTVVLWLYGVDQGAGNEVAVPMAFKVAGRTATGEFYMSSSWVKAEVTAKYSQHLCGPSLNATVNF